MQRVLFIEDDAAICEVISLFLGGIGHQVKVAHDGDQGIELLEAGERFNIIVTDIGLPTTSGNEVARFIRKSSESDDDTPPILVAITGSEYDAEQGLFDGLLQKPFKLHELSELIASFH